LTFQDITDKTRSAPEYTEGDIAFSNFMTVDECPYESCGRDGADETEGAKRLSWMAGWYDANAKATFPKLFDPDHPEYQPEAG
jgi:hypothetical protein